MRDINGNKIKKWDILTLYSFISEINEYTYLFLKVEIIGIVLYAIPLKKIYEIENGYALVQDETLQKCKLKLLS